MLTEYHSCLQGWAWFNWGYNGLGPISEEQAKSPCICSNLTCLMMLLSFWFWRICSTPKFYSTENFKTVFKELHLKSDLNTHLMAEHSVSSEFSPKFVIFGLCLVCKVHGYTQAIYNLQAFWTPELPYSTKLPSALKGGKDTSYGVSIHSVDWVVHTNQIEPASIFAISTIQAPCSVLV